MTTSSALEKIGGCSLSQSFTQEDACETRSTQAKQDDQAQGLKNKRGVDLDKIQHLKVGTTVAYTKGTGTVVSKDGSYVTIYNEEVGNYDIAHAGETYIPGDTISMGIMNKLWDQMTYEQHSALLHKAQIQEPLHFISRMWSDIPSTLQEAIKSHSNDVTKEVTFASEMPSAGKPTRSPSSTSVGSQYSGKAPKGATRDSGGTRRPGTGPKSLGGKQESTAHTTTSANSKRSKPGNLVNTTIGGKKVQVSEKERKTYESHTPKNLRDDPGFSSDYGKKISTKKSFAELAVALYQIKNDITKVGSAKPSTPAFAPLPGTTQGGPKAKPDANTKVMPDQVRTRRGGKDGYPGQKQDQAGSGRTIGDALADKSDVEHGTPGGVVTDTPFDATEDYEECREEVHGKEFDHNTQQKTPKDIKEGEGVKKINQNLVPFKQGKKGDEDEVEKTEGGGGFNYWNSRH